MKSNPNVLIISISKKERKGSVIELDSSNVVYRRYYWIDNFSKETLFGPDGWPIKIYKKNFVTKEEYAELNDPCYLDYREIIDKLLEDSSAKNIRNSFSFYKNYCIIYCIDGEISFSNKKTYVKMANLNRIFGVKEEEPLADLVDIIL